jgi:pilus assembly protein Flp/PilA
MNNNEVRKVIMEDLVKANVAEEKINQNNKRRNSERGASMVEYALLVALIAIIAIVAVRTVGNQVSTNFSSITQELNT